MSWSLISSSPISGKIYARPLGLNEQSYYFDRIFNGSGDMFWRYLVEETDRANGVALFSEDNVKRAWATLKQWYPLLGAHMDDTKGIDALQFVISERDLSHHHPDEISFLSTKSREEVEAYVWMLQRDKPMQDHHLISRLFIFRHEGCPGTYEVLFRVAHAITDGMSQPTIARTFFDLLASPPAPLPELEERLAMALPYNELNPTQKLSLAQQRWRHAIALVFFLNRRRKLTGGHTIPRAVTDKTYRTPSVPERVGYCFPVQETEAILATCRKHKVTFGTAIHVISQLAITRVLHRRYLRGDITEQEWEDRRRQPMHVVGSINLRPYMDADWRKKGGETEVALTIDAYECTLPFMPAPFASRRDDGVPRVDGAPPFAALMSSERFFHRVGLCRQQVKKFISNPVMLDIAHVRELSSRHRKKVIATHWLAEKRGEPLPDLPMPAHWDSLPADCVFAICVSSLGQLSFIQPPSYPLPQGHPLSVRTPRPRFGAVSESSAPLRRLTTPDADALLKITDEMMYLHGRPGWLTLVSSTSFGQLRLVMMFDRSVYKVGDVEELIQECRKATLHYLGGGEVFEGNCSR